MSDDGPTWIVMIRDVSHAISVQDQSAVIASLILDADTGLVRGLSLGGTARGACAQAIRTALTRPAGPLPPQPPGRVLHDQAHVSEVLDELAAALPDDASPDISCIPPLAEAEDIFDSLIGHLAGRAQPDDPPGPADWQHFYLRAGEYCRSRPWDRWSDADHLDLRVRIGAATTRYLAVVMGNAGIQRGLALYPGAALPSGMSDWRPGDPPPTPPGTLLLWLDPPDEVPAEFTARATRYGWPDDHGIVPLPLAVTADGPADVDRTQTHHLTVAMTAVLAHRRGPAGAEGTTGNVDLTDGDQASFTIR